MKALHRVLAVLRQFRQKNWETWTILIAALYLATAISIAVLVPSRGALIVDQVPPPYLSLFGGTALAAWIAVRFRQRTKHPKRHDWWASPITALVSVICLELLFRGVLLPTLGLWRQLALSVLCLQILGLVQPTSARTYAQKFRRFLGDVLASSVYAWAISELALWAGSIWVGVAYTYLGKALLGLNEAPTEGEGEDEEPHRPVWIQAIVMGMQNILLALLVSRRTTGLSALYALSQCRWWYVLLGIGLSALFVLELAAVMKLLPRFNRFIRDTAALRGDADVEPQISASWLGLVVCALVAGTTEEILFRGALQAWLGLPLSLLLFGVIHEGYEKDGRWLSLSQALRAGNAVLIGLNFGVSVMVTQSLWPAIIAHCLHNFIVSASILLVRDKDKWQAKMEKRRQWAEQKKRELAQLRDARRRIIDGGDQDNV